jgi:hypothetical protein
MRLKLLVAASALVLPASLIAQTTSDSGAPATTGAPAATTAPAGDTSTSATPAAGPVTAATKADIKAGAEVLDQAGDTVGTVESVTASGAVVSTGKVRAEIPFASFGKNDKGLVIAMTKTQLEAQATPGTGS